MPHHLKKSKNQAYLENGTIKQIERHLERVMELNGFEADEPGENANDSCQTTI